MSIDEASGSAAARFYADFRGLAALRKDAKAQTPESVRAAARQFESLFTQMMLKSMRAATPGDSLFSSDQENFYRDMFDQQMSVQLSQGKGLGLADMLVQQLMRNGVAGAAAAAGSGAASSTATGAGALQGAGAVPRSGADSLPIATNNAWPQSRADFVNALMPAAQQAGAQLGVDPHTLIAHAALETNWGRSIPSTEQGGSSFNLFGVKAGASWAGPEASAATTEYVAGQPVSMRDEFRAYASPADSIKDYAALLRTSPRYAAALGTGSDTAAFATALQRGGYATDPDYAAKLVAVAQSLKSGDVRSLTSGRAA